MRQFVASLERYGVVTVIPVLVGMLWGCRTGGPARPATTPDTRTSLRVHTTEIDRADTLLRAGCFVCIREALSIYDGIREQPLPSLLSERVQDRAVQAALLLDVLERQLGMVDDGYLAKAQARLRSRPNIAATLDTLVNMVATIPWHWTRTEGAIASESDRQRFQVARTHRAAWEAQIRPELVTDEAVATIWLAFMCAHAPRSERAPEMLGGAVGPMSDRPIVRYQLATCGEVSTTTLQTLLENDGRFREIEYWLGTAALSARQLDQAETHLRRAFAWQSDWPVAAATLAGIVMTSEDLGGALALYDHVLRLLPHHRDALMGRVRALSILGRPHEALFAIEALEHVQWFQGEVWYWRAWNEQQLGRLQEAWASVVEAERVWINSNVTKLVAILAYKRGDFESAKTKLASAAAMVPSDCDVPLLLADIEVAQQAWQPAADAFTRTLACLEEMTHDLAREIAILEESTGIPERIATQVQSRRRRIELAERTEARSKYNLAVAYLNQAHKGDALRYAQMLVTDVEFGLRARQLIERIGH